MLGKGLCPKEVSDYLGIDDSTVYRYADSYHEDGLEVYLRIDYQGYWGLLSYVQMSELRAELNSTLYTKPNRLQPGSKSVGASTIPHRER